MDIPGTRKQQAAERRAQILDAACGVFAQKGYAGASMRDIAREVGVTEGLLYHYFAGKSELIHACWRERSFKVELRAILDERRNAPAEVALTEMLKKLMVLLYVHGPEIRLHVAEMHRDPELAGFFVRKVEEDLEWLIEFLRARQDAGEVLPDAPVVTTAKLIMGAAHSLFMVWGTTDQDNWNRIINTDAPAIVRIILHGICAPSRDAVQAGHSAPTDR